MSFHLELRNVSKSVFHRVNETKIRTLLFSDLNLKIGRGELVTIMGASGSGKTTLLRLINRLSDPDSGTILLNSIDICSMPPQELRKKAGMVFQLPVMFQGSVRENIAFGMELWGESMDINALAKDAGVPEKLLDADTGRLSVGEKQRVCIARALSTQPELLLLDEPTSSLDSISAQKIETMLLGLQRDHDLTMVWVTHEKEQAGRIGGRRLILKDGKLEEHAED
ncbi:MAG: phosphate ABC transporter ATP-binding protein [Candidatus Methanoperedens sp.]|jgi:putative ABC transport system ATP-binding protein|nr:phosphate ABC transporter ATP-binding protein [Candidatus Methanoperedens sp.]PKL53229.1 MAG: phosphate ABC transporter ATP-binding protein [Candidatus Methanoperedenaceae archaeon HGW-Methanoperedenaceae-1]